MKTKNSGPEDISCLQKVNLDKHQDNSITFKDLEDNYCMIIDNLLVGICIIQEGLFKCINKTLLHMLGYEKPDLLIGEPLWDIALNEDRSLVKSRFFKYNRNHILPNRFTFRAQKRDRSIIWMEMGIKSINYQGKKVHLINMIDITEFKIAEEALWETKNRYRIALEEIEDGIGEIDISGKVLFCNNSFIKIYGYPSDELIGLDFREYLDKDTAESVYKAYNKVYVTGVPNKGFAYEIICKNRTRRFIENSISLMKNADGLPIGFRSVVRDVTNKKQTEKELVKHRGRLASIFSSVRDAIITVDTNMVVIEANKAVNTLCGMSSESITGKVFTAVSNHCKKSCHRLIKETLEIKKTIKEYRIECGSHQVVVVNSSPLLDQDGKYMGGVLVIRDITRLNDLEKELKERYQFHNIIGKSKKMQKIYKLLEDLADIETTILVTGESGTGKELIAKAVHNGGNRAFKTFIAVNCSALSENLLESELFGHVKGAFTGAIRDHEGRFKAADGGTILLDEIGDISPKIQLKLLRVLQEKEFERVGDLTPVKVDVRIIACTNRDLAEMVRNREFREDLYYRLKVVEIKIPPLRERFDDIPLLVNHFCSLLNKRFKKNIEVVSDEVLEVFMNYNWPGNIRELEHAMERAFVICRSQNIMISQLPSEIKEFSRNTTPVSKTELDDGREATLLALTKTDWNKAKAARLMCIDRSTLYRRIKKYKISKPRE